MVERIALPNRLQSEERKDSPDHLPRGDHRRINVLTTGFDEDVRVSHADRAHQQREATLQSRRAFDLHLIVKDQTHASDAYARANQLSRRESFVRQMVMGEDESESGDRRLQYRRQPRVDVLLAPEYQAEVQRDGNQSHPREFQPIAPTLRQRPPPHDNYRPED